MDAGVFVPLAVFAVVVLIVAITSMAKMRDKEMEVHQRLYIEELEHQRKIKELTLELERIRHLAQSFSPSATEKV
jgi:hypothetical protein